MRGARFGLGVAAAVAAGLGLGASCGGDRRSSPPPAGQAPQAVASAFSDGQHAGPRAVEAGVPVGYTRSAAGAAAAATQFLGTLTRLVHSDGPTREAALRRIAAPSASGVVDGGLAALGAVDRLVAEARARRPGARVLLTDVPVAYRVEQAGGDTARVDVWSVGLVLFEGATEATEVWSTSSLDFIWSGGDWRVVQWSRTSGPAPAVRPSTAARPDDVLNAVADWRGFRHDPLP
ncbi:MAG: hypothetical protein AB1679_18710 [Actinomycetota bacterium]